MNFISKTYNISMDDNYIDYYFDDERYIKFRVLLKQLYFLSGDDQIIVNQLEEIDNLIKTAKLKDGTPINDSGMADRIDAVIIRMKNDADAELRLKKFKCICWLKSMFCNKNKVRQDE